MDVGQEGSRRWTRPAVLLVIPWVISVIPNTPLIALPLLAQLALLPRPRSGPALLAAMGAALFAFWGPAGDSVWYLVRGWAVLIGFCFVAVTLFRPVASFTGRALATLVLSTGIAVGLFRFAGPDWQVVDWQMGNFIGLVGATAMEAVRLLVGERTAAPAVLAGVARLIEWQTQLYPGILLVASVCGLGVAWWLYVRVAQGSDRALGPLRDFRFHHAWVWVVVAGLALTLWGTTDGWVRAGANALVFMAALYTARGAAVIVFLTGGVSVGGVALTLLGMTLLPRLMVGTALMVGLSDTWLDIRERARAMFNG
ncbi:MAG: DUF2232 domain-containing protein [Gemmatimonadota bacterium]